MVLNLIKNKNWMSILILKEIKALHLKKETIKYLFLQNVVRGKKVNKVQNRSLVIKAKLQQNYQS